jgi:hypothetical protein
VAVKGKGHMTTKLIGSSMLNENSGGGSATRTFGDNPSAKQTSNQSEALRIREGFVLPVRPPSKWQVVHLYGMISIMRSVSSAIWCIFISIL